MFLEFERELATTGYTYDIQLEHRHKRFNPVYTDPANAGTFQNSFIVDYDGFYNNQIMPILYPDNTTPKKDSSRMYKLTEGDYFYVKVKNTNKTNAGIVRDFLNNSISENTRIYIPYGGMVLNEDY